MVKGIIVSTAYNAAPVRWGRLRQEQDDRTEDVTAQGKAEPG